MKIIVMHREPRTTIAQVLHFEYIQFKWIVCISCYCYIFVGSSIFSFGCTTYTQISFPVNIPDTHSGKWSNGYWVIVCVCVCVLWATYWHDRNVNIENIHISEQSVERNSSVRGYSWGQTNPKLFNLHIYRSIMRLAVNLLLRKLTEKEKKTLPQMFNIQCSVCPIFSPSNRHVFFFLHFLFLQIVPMVQQVGTVLPINIVPLSGQPPIPFLTIVEQFGSETNPRHYTHRTKLDPKMQTETIWRSAMNGRFQCH